MKRSLILLVCFCFAGCAALEKNPRKEEAKARWEQMRAKVKYQLAERNFAAGQVDEAMKLCQEVLALYPTFLDGYLLMSRIQLEKGRTSEAEAALDTASGLGQPVPELDYLRGVLAERREEMADALDWYRRAYEALPEEPDYLVGYVEALLNLERLEEAMNVLQERHRDFEQDARVQLLHAQVLSLLGREDEAASAYLGLLRLAPGDPLLREEVVLALLSASRFDEAQAVLEPMLRSGENKPSAPLLHSWATALLEHHHPDTAVSVLKQAAAMYPEAFSLRLLLGKAYLMLNQPAPARDAAREACGLRPASTEAKLLLAYSCLAGGDPEEAISLAQAIIAAAPDDAEALAIMAQAAGSGTAHQRR